jgi:hypothetical protein
MRGAGGLSVLETVTLEPPLSSSLASPNQHIESGAPSSVPSSYFLDKAMECFRAARC